MKQVSPHTKHNDRVISILGWESKRCQSVCGGLQCSCVETHIDPEQHRNWTDGPEQVHWHDAFTAHMEPMRAGDYENWEEQHNRLLTEDLVKLCVPAEQAAIKLIAPDWETELCLPVGSFNWVKIFRGRVLSGILQIGDVWWEVLDRRLGCKETNEVRNKWLLS